MDKKWTTFCCNPFQKKSHWVNKDLRAISSWMIDFKDYNIEEGMKICTSCRVKLGKERQALLDEMQAKEESVDKEDEGDTIFMDLGEGLNQLNASLTSIGESPIVKKKCDSSNKYCKEKIEKIKCKLNETFFHGKGDYEQKCGCEYTESEIIDQFKEKFRIANKSEKFLILTALPKSWSCARIESEFGVSNYLARKSKKLIEEKGILSTPDSKPGRTLPQETATLVKDFYCSDEISRLMPGKKDYVSMGKNSEGNPIHVQKRLILLNLREAYQLFKSNTPDVKVGFSKFVELRPKNCIIAGASGTHAVCVCTVHQNVKLMMAGANLNKVLLLGSDQPLKTYKECLPKIMCSPPNQSCFLNDCDYCPDVNIFRDALLTALEEDMVESVTYKQWISVDRCTFETLTKPTEEFVQEFSKQLVNLKRHDFVAKQQSSFYSEKKSALSKDEVIVQCDFSENYSFVLQDEAQSFHWNNSMATVHPCVVYYKETNENNTNVLTHKSFVFISDCLTHNTVLVHVFQKKLIDVIKKDFMPNLKKIYYFSDGSAAQYKNRKNFINLCHHAEDFDGIEAEWHFYATSHGKGACDGIGGTVKRLATKASLQSPINNQILTSLQLYQWGRDNISSVIFIYVANDEFMQEEKILANRFEEAVTVTGTQSYHAFIPVSKTKIKTKIISDTENSDLHNIQVAPNADDVPFEEINGFVACAYDSLWWIACVLSKNYSEKEVTISFLHPHGPSASFVYPRRPDVVTVPHNFILCSINPTTPTGRTYTLSADEMFRASEILSQKKQALYS